MGTKVVKPVFLKNIHIEGQERPSIFLSLLSYQQKAHLIFIPCFYCILIPLSFPSQQESPTRPSASPARRAPSATPPAPPRVKPALGTPSLATAPVPARPVTPPPTTPVGAYTLLLLFMFYLVALGFYFLFFLRETRGLGFSLVPHGCCSPTLCMEPRNGKRKRPILATPLRQRK